MKNRKYYAEQAVWGADKSTVKVFDSKEARDEFVNSADYTNKITAAEAKRRMNEIEPCYRQIIC